MAASYERLVRAAYKADQAGATEDRDVLLAEAAKVAPKGSALDLFAQGLTIGSSDEIYGAARAAATGAADPGGEGFGEEYDFHTRVARDRIKQYREKHPWRAFGAEAAGAIAGTAAMPFSGIGRAGMYVPRLLRAGRWGRAAGRSLLGLSEGALYGFNTGEGAANRALRAGEGAAVGAVAAPVVGGAFDAARHALANVPRRARVNRAMRTGPGQSPGGIQPAAGRRLLDLRDQVGIQPGETARQMQAAGPRAMAMDTSEALLREAEDVVNTDNAASRGLAQTIQERAQGAAPRMASEFDAALGPTPNIARTLDGMEAAQRSRGRPLFRQARANARRPNAGGLMRTIDEVINENKGTALARELRGIRGTIQDILDEGGRSAREVFDQLHRLRAGRVRGLNNKLSAAASSPVQTGTTGRWEAQQSQRVYDAMTEMLDNASLDPRTGTSLYRTARMAWAGDGAVRDAFEYGRTALDRRVHPDFLRERVRNMGTGERSALALGMRSALQDKIGNVVNDDLAARRAAVPQAVREKFRIVLNRRDADALLQAVDMENTAARVRKIAVEGSPTQRRQSARSRYDRASQPDVPGVTDIINKAPAWLASKIWKDLQGGRLDERALGIAKLLSEQGPEAVAAQQALDAAQRARNVRMPMDTIADALQVPLELVGRSTTRRGSELDLLERRPAAIGIRG